MPLLPPPAISEQVKTVRAALLDAYGHTSFARQQLLILCQDSRLSLPDRIAVGELSEAMHFALQAFEQVRERCQTTHILRRLSSPETVPEEVTT